jgi:hypothetical protein
MVGRLISGVILGFQLALIVGCLLQRGGTVIIMVNDLIDPYTGQWEHDILTSIFNHVDVQRILQIPLAYNSFDDFLACY